MTRLSRDLLVNAFPDNPRLRGQFEELDLFLDDAETRVTALLASAEDAASRLTAIESSTNQPHSTIMDAISGLPNDSGAVELLGDEGAQLRGIDSDDDACLVSRGQLMSYAGKGATADRPVLSASRRAVYFDTTLAADGKPVFWTGTAWVDATGVVA